MISLISFILISINAQSINSCYMSDFNIKHIKVYKPCYKAIAKPLYIVCKGIECDVILDNYKTLHMFATIEILLDKYQTYSYCFNEDDL